MADPLFDVRVVHEAAPLVELSYAHVGTVDHQVHSVAAECERFLDRSQEQLSADTVLPSRMLYEQRVHDELSTTRRPERCSPNERTEHTSYKLN